MKTVTADTCAQAWLSATNYLRTKESWSDFNVILEITDPMAVTDQDKAVFSLVDALLLKNETSVDTVVNTIFPARLYSTNGAKDLCKKYEELLPKIKMDRQNRWGTYFLRMTQRKDASGEPFNPLLDLVKKLKGQREKNQPPRPMYEMNTFDPLMDIQTYSTEQDRKGLYGPCLSHLSFKPNRNGLMLTGLYRSHYYIARALGNLCGLAWLQHFVAQEAGFKSSSLTCISTLAKIDTGFGKREVIALIDECNRAYGSKGS